MNAKFIQDLLNTTDLVFRITDERQEFDTYKATKDVAGILVQLNSNYLYDDSGNRVNTFQIEFKGANKDFDAFVEVLKDFPNNEYIEGLYFFAQPPIFDDFADEGGRKQFSARMFFQTVEVVGGISGKSTTIKVDGVEIDFTNVLYRQDKSLLPTKAFGNNKEVRMVSELLSIKIPMSDNAKNVELIMAGADNTYNKSYLVEWKMGAITKTFDAVMRVGISEYSKTYEPLMWTLTFERALPREEWGVGIWQEGNYWEIDRTPQHYDVREDLDFENETDFLNFLMEEYGHKLDTIGYTVRAGTNFVQTWEILEGSPTKIHDLYEFDNNDILRDSWELTLEDIEIYLSYYPAQYVGFTYKIETQQVDTYEMEIVGNDIEGYTPGGPITAMGTINGNGTQAKVVELLTALYPEDPMTGIVYSIIDTYDSNVWYFTWNEIRRFWYARVKSIEGDFWFGKVNGGGQYSLPINAPVIDYSAKHSVETTTRVVDDKVVGDPAFYGNGFVVLFFINDVTQQFIDDLYERLGNHYKITFTIGSKTYSYEDLIITDIERQNTETANQIMQVTFAEGGIL